MAYQRVPLSEAPGLGQWAMAITAIAGAVGAIAPAVAQIVAKPPRAPAPLQILMAAPTLAPTAVAAPAAPFAQAVPFAQAGMLGGMPTWGWVAVGGGGLLLLLLFAGGGGGGGGRGRPVYVMERRRRRR